MKLYPLQERRTVHEGSKFFTNCGLLIKELKLIYTTPKTLNRDVVFKEIVKTMGEKYLISYLIYDEAHCISQWGNGFRPDYLAVAEMSKILVPKAPTILLSATATQDAIADIK